MGCGPVKPPQETEVGAMDVVRGPPPTGRHRSDAGKSSVETTSGVCWVVDQVGDFPTQGEDRDGARTGDSESKG